MCSITSHSSPRSSATAFSLIEIVLALAIISFALVAILGLFPVAIQAATSSQQETHAALIARSIYSDLDAQSGGTRYLLLGKDETSDSSSSSGEQSSRFATKVDVDLTSTESKSYYLAYDSDGQPLKDKISTEEYDRGFPKAGYLAKITVLPSETSTPGIFPLEITVGAPASAAVARRTSHPFLSLLNNGKIAH